MKSFLFYQYSATGEGWTTEIIYTDDHRVTDEMAIEKWKSEHDEYFHCGLKVYTPEEARANPDIMRKLFEHVPKFHDFIANDLPCYSWLDYKHHQNYS